MFSAVQSYFRPDTAPTPLQHPAEWSVFSHILTSEILAATERQNGFNQDIIGIIAGYLQDTSLSNFGPQEWNSLYGRVEIVNPPLEIERALNSEDPLNPGKLVKETCFLLFIPNRVNKVSLTLKYILNSYLNLKDNTDPKIKKKFGHLKNETSYWILIHKQLIPGSNSLLIERAKKENWELATVREAAISFYIRKSMPNETSPIEEFRVVCENEANNHPCLAHFPDWSSSVRAIPARWKFHLGATINSTVFLRRFFA